MSKSFTEAVVEDVTMKWLKALGYTVRHGSDFAGSGPRTERSGPNYRDGLLELRLRQALVRFNPDLPFEPLEDAFRHVLLPVFISGVLRMKDAERLTEIVGA